MHSILVTPNLRGSNGIACLSRQLLRALPGAPVVLSLHDDPSPDVPPEETTPDSAEGTPPRLISAGGNTARFLADAARLAMETARDTVVVCCHLHLAAVARAVAWRGGRGLSVTQLLCGIEAWVPLRPTERWALGSGRLVAISRHTARRFKEANPGFEQVRVEICHPGLPPSRMPPSWTTATEPAALVVGRMNRAEGYKGHQLLIDLWPRVRQVRPEAQLWVVGDGDDRPRLEALAIERGLGGSVTFPGRISDEALADLYRRCRVFVMPSRDEGFGLVFLEAMRAGKPCIGARGAAEEIIDHEKTGLIVDPARPEDVLTAITELVGNAAMCDAFGRAGAARFAAMFTDAHFAARLEPLLVNDSHEVSHALVR